MRVQQEQNFDYKYIERQNFEGDERSSREGLQFYHESQISEDKKNVISFGNLKKSTKLFNSLPILALIVAFGIIWFEDFQTYDNRAEYLAQQQKRKWKHAQNVRKVCYVNENWNDQVFFISFDFSDITRKDVEDFEKTNRVCNFQIKREIAFNHFVNLWNHKDENVRNDKYFINKTTLSEEQRRQIFIWLKLYYRGGIYIHASLGLNFGKYLSDEYLLKKSAQNQIIFAEYDHEKRQQGIYTPEKNFKTVKVEHRLSEKVGNVIKKIILEEDWMELCENSQCIVVKDGIKLSKQL